MWFEKPEVESFDVIDVIKYIFSRFETFAIFPSVMWKSFSQYEVSNVQSAKLNYFQKLLKMSLLKSFVYM